LYVTLGLIKEIPAYPAARLWNKRKICAGETLGFMEEKPLDSWLEGKKLPDFC
jgi:hypothetical protein